MGGRGEQQTLKDRTYLPPVSNCMQKREGKLAEQAGSEEENAQSAGFIAENGEI